MDDNDKYRSNIDSRQVAYSNEGICVRFMDEQSDGRIRGMLVAAVMHQVHGGVE